MIRALAPRCLRVPRPTGPPPLAPAVAAAAPAPAGGDDKPKPVRSVKTPLQKEVLEASYKSALSMF